ncbi:hypothetical protein [Corynebacterium lehmanniae]|uniref:Uncharacterized protein n=1 Tax=Corynebacterium lehmanniae TaxID=2913497 RepID=A0ABT4R794_9CORY|nr:hypothetical protein [Corynebacterium lehmanniae]MCZ9291426.1 hypothetical protein [Corynebacterium lehmanniae]
MTNDFARPTDNALSPLSTAGEAFEKRETPHRKLTVKLDPDQYQQFRLAALLDNRTMTDVVKEKIDEYLAGRNTAAQ